MAHGAQMYFDEFKHQLPDIDEQETNDWVRSLDDVVAQEGETRARFLLFKLLKRARVSPSWSTTSSSEWIQSSVSAVSMSGSWCLNSSKYMGWWGRS